MKVKCTIDANVGYQEASELRDAMISAYDLRDFVLEEDRAAKQGLLEGQVAKGHDLAFFISNKETKETLMVANKGNFELSGKFLTIDITVFGTDANFVKLTKASKMLVETKSIFLKPNSVQFVKYSETFNVHDVMLNYEGLGLDDAVAAIDAETDEEEVIAGTDHIPNNAIADALKSLVDKPAELPRHSKPASEPSAMARRMAAMSKSKDPTPTTVSLPSGGTRTFRAPTMEEVAGVPLMDQLQDLADHLNTNPRPNMDDMREVIDDSYGKREAAVQLTATYTKEEQVDDFLNRMEEVFPGSSVEERLAYAMFAVKQVKTMTAIASKMEPGK
jgi:hypothetical protein